MSTLLEPSWNLEEIAPRVEELRLRVNRLRRQLALYYVAKEETIDLMILCTLAQEPLLIVGKPGTAKSDLVIRFCQALGLVGSDYFEYMLTKFTEPSEILGPIDINRLKEGAYLRRVSGKLPEAKIVFLDEIFKSNSAILNTLLTVINERKYYQDGQPLSVPLVMLFGATNEIPEFSELAALRDRFTLKIESEPVREQHFDDLIRLGLRNEAFSAYHQTPWQGLASLQDFLQLKIWADHLLFESHGSDDFEPYGPLFPEALYALFRRILRTLAREDGIQVTDRKVIKLYKLIRFRAFLFHGGEVRKEDLSLLRYVADRLPDFPMVREKVDKLLRLE